MACDGESPLLRSRNVCVIGAGMAGLAAARELRREGHAVTVMEQGGDIGGQWLYDPRTEEGDLTAPARVHSSMYESLRLMSPRESMGFSDFQFFPKHGVSGRDPRRFPGHREVYCYLREFCDAFGLMDFIRLNTKVLRVAMAAPPLTGRWEVRSVRLGGGDTGEEEEEAFDAVVVATGHYSQPKLPSINGMNEWRRRQLHSHSYRVPEPFRGEVVVIVGCGDSGKDIALDLLRVAREVHLTAKSTEEAMSTPAMCKLLAKYGNLHLHPEIERLCGGGGEDDGRVVFADGSSVVADTVMYCTGYAFSFPFLDTGGAVTIDNDNRVGPLFEHVFPPSLAPSLSFVGITRKVIAPWFFEVQGKWIAQVLSGRRSLPPEAEMLQSVEAHYRAREAAGIPPRYNHDIGGIETVMMYEFAEKYCDLGQNDQWKLKLVLSSLKHRNDDIETSRDCDDDSVSENVRKELQIWHAAAAEAQQGAAGVDEAIATSALN